MCYANFSGGNQGNYPYQGKSYETPKADSDVSFRYRGYDPTLMRFMQEDPIGYKDGMNLYPLEGGNPVNRLDPNGTDFEYANGMKNIQEAICRIKRVLPYLGMPPKLGNDLQALLDGGKIYLDDLGFNDNGKMGATYPINNGDFAIDINFAQGPSGGKVWIDEIAGAIAHENLHLAAFQNAPISAPIGDLIWGDYSPLGYVAGVFAGGVSSYDHKWHNPSEYYNYELQRKIRDAVAKDIEKHPCACKS